MSMQSIVISGYESGVQKDKKPFLFTDDAFQKLENAYVWRNQLKKRRGLKFIGRFRRVLTSQVISTTTAASDTLTISDLFSDLSITGEANANIEPGSLVITVAAPDSSTFTDNGDGTFAVTGLGDATGSYVNYATGEIVLNFTIVLAGGAAITVDVNYFPGLPAMGIWVRELSGVNTEQTIWFDTKYSYLHDGANFQEFLSGSAVTWNGTDSDFFWCTNYRGSDADTRLFFETNFVASAGSPMRYTDGSTWTDFQPLISGTSQTDVLTTTLAFGSASYGPALLTASPIIQGSVKIVVSDNAGVENDVVFRDTPKDGTLVSSGSNSGTITYGTGSITLNFSPVLPGAGNWTVTATYTTGATYLFTARILIPYYGRLLAFNTYEGAAIGSSVNIYNRCRFSQIGSPVQQDAWLSDVFGKGGFIDAPVNEEITSATFYKNTLIVTFERSTWKLQYIGEYGIPFIWERISSDFGSESPFSSVLFDDGVLTVGDKAIVGSSGTDVQRIDLQIPDTVYDFRNEDNGPSRVQGVRDFKNELVFWCYVDHNIVQSNQYFPNKTLVYNYRNNTFSFFRNNVTCFGTYQYPTGITWDRTDIFWDDPVLWDSDVQKYYPVIVCANQQGFASFYGFPDVETSADSTIEAQDQETLAINDVVVTTVVTLTVPNHNLLNDEFIYITGLIYGTSTTLNDQIYGVVVVDEDTITLNKWDTSSQIFYDNFDVTNVGDYLGGGVIALFPKMDVTTKDFNPMKNSGMNIKTSYIDFLFDAFPASSVQVKVNMNTDTGTIANLLLGNTDIEQSQTKFGNITGVTLANPCVITSTNHGLLSGTKVLFTDIQGTVELNGNEYTATFVDKDNFSVNVDSTLFTAYTQGGYWIQTKEEYYNLGSNYSWHRFFATCFGQYLSLTLTYSNDQMSQIKTNQQDFVLNAMQIYYRPGGKNVFGK